MLITSAVSSMDKPPKQRNSTTRAVSGSAAVRAFKASSSHRDCLIQRLMVRARAAFLRQAVTGVFHQDPPHRLRSGAEEVRSAAPLHAILIHQPQVGLVYQRRAIQRAGAVFVL